MRSGPWIRRTALLCALVAGALTLAAGCRHKSYVADAEPALVETASSRMHSAVPVTKPELRTITYTVAQPGFVEAFEQTAIYSKVSGFILRYCVDIGDQVKKGELLLEIFDPELNEEQRQAVAQIELDKKGVEQAERLVDVAQRNLQTAIAELAESKANVGKFEADVARWTSELSRLTPMAKEKVLDYQVVDETQKQLQSTKAARDAAQSGVAAKEAARASREADLAKARVDVEFAKSKVRVAEAQERRVAAMVGYMKIKAPYDGIVTVRNANTGDYVQAVAGDKENSKGVPIFVVARTDVVRVFVDVPEAYARYVHIGTKASIRAEALHGLEVPATVTRTSWDLNVRTRALRTEIDIPAKGYEGLRPGMYVCATVIIEKPNVLALPEQAVSMHGSQPYCYLLIDGKAVKTPIQRGLSDGTWVEVVKRQSGGAWTPFTGKEQVIGGDLTEIVDGQPVEVAHQQTTQSAGSEEAGRHSELELGLALWQRLQQAAYAGVGNLGAADVQHPKLGQSFEMFQAGVRDRGAIEVQYLELAQPLEMPQAGVRDLGARKFQALKIGQATEVLQAGARDLGFIEPQVPELRQARKVLQAGVRDPGVRQT
jgi:HlyD family secretion protein